jgi:hypothetical protein
MLSEELEGWCVKNTEKSENTERKNVRERA